MRSRAWTGPSSTRSTTTTSSPATAPWASKSSRTAPDVRTVIAAIGGGGLITGVGSAIKALRPDVQGHRRGARDRGALCAVAREGGPRKFTDWQASFVDGAGGKSVTERMWERMQPVVDGAITVTLDEMREAMRLMAEKARVIAEGRRRAGAGRGADRRKPARGRSCASSRAAISTSANSPSWSATDQRPVTAGGRGSNRSGKPRGCERRYWFGALTLRAEMRGGVPRPARIVEDGARQARQIGVAGADDRLGLLVLGDEADRDDRHVASPP